MNSDNILALFINKFGVAMSRSAYFTFLASARAVLLAITLGGGVPVACAEPAAARPEYQAQADTSSPDSRLYSLPYKAGQAYRMTQAYGGDLRTHSGAMQHAIDFEMPVGTPVLAARGGTVAQTEAKFTEGRLSEDMIDSANYVVVQHSDGSVAMYAHLSHNGVAVTQGQVVREGDLLGYSGDTGMSSGPHLHFAVSAPIRAGGVLAETTLPIRFRVGPYNAAQAPFPLAMLTAWFDGNVSPDTPVGTPIAVVLDIPSSSTTSVALDSPATGAGVGAYPAVTDAPGPQAVAAQRAVGGSNFQEAPSSAGQAGHAGKLLALAGLLVFWRISRAARGA